MLYYISAMMLFRLMTERNKPMEKSFIHEKMKDVPTSIVDGLLERFTEVERGAVAK